MLSCYFETKRILFILGKYRQFIEFSEVDFIIMAYTFIDHTVLGLESGIIKVSKIGKIDKNGNERIVLGCRELGYIKENGKQFSDLCAFNDSHWQKHFSPQIRS